MVSEDIERTAHEVIGAAIEVHRQLGPGFLESTYELALASELELRGIPFRRQVAFKVHYKDELVGEGRLDFLVRDHLVLEVKAVEYLSPVHLAQTLSYLRANRLPLGLLLNFNVAVLKDGLRRVVDAAALQPPAELPRTMS